VFSSRRKEKARGLCEEVRSVKKSVEVLSGLICSHILEEKQDCSKMRRLTAFQRFLMSYDAQWQVPVLL
jgi:hypothetical protein